MTNSVFDPLFGKSLDSQRGLAPKILKEEPTLIIKNIPPPSSSQNIPSKFNGFNDITTIFSDPKNQLILLILILLTIVIVYLVTKTSKKKKVVTYSTDQLKEDYYKIKRIRNR